MSVDCLNNDMNVKVKKDISVVPWYNSAQFKKVYEFLYSSNIVKKRWAVDQISVWETRCQPSLPTAIEASVVLSRAIIQDILFTNGATLCQERDVQMMYSMALVRFVNLSIEVHQQNPPNVTAAHLARGLGIPSWVIDLRNEATHSFGPSLPSLRMAAEASMKFLNDSYWAKISTPKNLEKEPFDEREIRQLIRSYVILQFSILKDKGKGNMQPEQFNNQDSEECKRVLKNLTLLAEKHKREFINILVSDGFFIPHDDEMKSLMSPSEFVQYEEACEEGDDVTEQPSIPAVPVELEKLWGRILKMLNSIQVIPLFLETLLKSQSYRTEMGKKLITSWAMKILRINTGGDSIKKGFLKRIFKRRGITADWYKMFHAAVSRPTLYTPFVFSVIYGQLNLTDDYTKYILTLMAISLGQADWKSVTLKPNSDIYTVEDLKIMKKLQNAKKEKTAEDGVWTLVQDPHYKSWPIGSVINPIDDSDKTEDQSDDFMSIERLDEKMDVTETYIITNNENDSEEEYFVGNQPDTSEDELDLSDRQNFLYRIK